MNNENTKIYVRVPGSRPKGFVEPKLFIWDKRRDKILWTKLSKVKSPESIDWKEVSSDLGAPEYFLRKRSYMLFHDQLKMLSEGIERNDTEKILRVEAKNDYNADLIEPLKHTTNDDVMNNLQSSRIMNHKIDLNEQGENDISSSELSNLSVSKSALEEALIDRLHL